MIKKVQVLAPHIAERIAAGEVIERPASVVKELIENSLDAGATEIIVNLENGGKELIEIIDNGHGMTPEDLELCVERHATSKLSSLDDLEKIMTLGFRGEAIPSVAAVSDLTLTSRLQNGESTYSLQLTQSTPWHKEKVHAQKITFGQFIDSPHGTRIQSRGLFLQMPARLKFLKSQSAEVSHVKEWMERIAIAYPHVGFQLISNEKVILNLRPQGEADRVLTLLSDGNDYPVLTRSSDQDGFRDLGLKVRLHWLQGLSSHQSRKLIQIVNSRAVKDRMLQQALLAPFRQTLLPGQFPAVALFIDINPAAIDVNVHPTKSEVRFLDSRKIFQSIDALVKLMIADHGAPAFVASSLSSPWNFSEPNSTSSFTPERRAEAGVGSSPSPSTSFLTQEFNPSHERHQESRYEHPRELPQFSTPFPGQSPTPETPQIGLAQSLLQSSRQMGSLFNTYLLFEKPEELILIDQHAAHERINFEKLKKRAFHNAESRKPAPSQALLIPEVVHFSEEHKATLDKRTEWLSQLGFEAEVFSEMTLLVRAVPAEWGTYSLKTRLKNFIDRIISLESNSSDIILDEILFESLASEACHSSIRAKDHLENEEIKTLVTELFLCEHPWNCPHGRPTVVRIPQGKFEEWFRRKV